MLYPGVEEGEKEILFFPVVFLHLPLQLKLSQKKTCTLTHTHRQLHPYEEKKNLKKKK